MQKERNNIDYGINDFYKYYKNNTVNPVSITKYKVIFSQLFKEIVKNIIENSFIFKLPYNLGNIGIVKYPPPKIVFTEDYNLDVKKSNLKIDFGATNKLWEEYPELKEQKKVLYHENVHSEGYTFKIKYNPSKLLKYTFVPARRFKRNLASYIKDNPNTEYYDF